jgi:predicted nucleotidyltransferase
MNTGIQPVVLEEIRALARRHGICKVILFGSRARGDYNPKSDIDLAVSGGEIELFRLDVEEETNTLLRFDVVNMDHALQPALLDAIRKEGQVLYEEI